MTNLAISQAAVQSWTVPTVSVARRKRYASALQVNGTQVGIFKSVPAALRSLGVTRGVRTIRAAARDSAFVELTIGDRKVIITTLEVSTLN